MNDSHSSGGPTIDVVIPAYNEEAHIGSCLDSVADQDYHRELVTIWVVDAGSTDATASIARERGERDPRIHLISEGRRLTTPAALNVGIARGSADLVARVDAHGWPERDFLRRAVEAFQSAGSELGCVGGRAQPAGRTGFGRALGLAWTSGFGVGGSVYAEKDDRALVDTVPWGMYKRSALLEAGLFDPEMPYGEDEDLNWRLRRAGYQVLLDGRVRFHYVPRDSWLGAFEQYRRYGEARVRVVRAHPSFLRAHHLVPASFVGLLLTLAAAASRSRGARGALGLLIAVYLSASVAAATRACRGRSARLVPLVASAFWALHLGYGAGTLLGAASALRSGVRRELGKR